MKNRERAKVAVRGAVQGVGFRPFVYHLATALGLEGWVSNSAQGVFIEVEGAHETLEKFLLQSMKKFRMCAACQKEYDDPHDRRFHAQPNACPHCGPHLELWDDKGNVAAKYHEALLQAAAVVRDGKILALKGLGGFQLLVDSRHEEAVTRLRKRKQREEKPFALMYPSRQSIQVDCRVSTLEERLLLAPESPIVLLKRNPQSEIRNPQSVSRRHASLLAAASSFAARAGISRRRDQRQSQ